MEVQLIWSSGKKNWKGCLEDPSKSPRKSPIPIPILRDHQHTALAFRRYLLISNFHLCQKDKFTQRRKDSTNNHNCKRGFSLLCVVAALREFFAALRETHQYY